MALVIAEAGENHCGDLDTAFQLTQVAATAGADYVKFQMYDAARVSPDDPEKEWFEKVQVSEAMLGALAEHARSCGIMPLCTPWDGEKAAMIFGLGIPDMKIASFHIVDRDLLQCVNKRARRVFLSTGMSSMEEIEAAVRLLDDVPELYLLHCVSEYPLESERVNLRVMDTLRAKFGARARIGYSDHTIGILAPVAAVAYGAEVIEKHITLDKTLPGTDHILSADPDELAQMVLQIREVERMMGSPDKKLTRAEAENQHFLRTRFQH